MAVDAHTSGVGPKVALGFVFVFAAFTTIMVSRYLTFNPDVFFEQQRQTYVDHPIGIFSHIIGGIVAMAIGPFQFIAGLRIRKPAIHRWLGRTYIAACIVGGLGGLYMAPHAYGGLPARLGFGMLALAWLTCAVMALVRVRSRDFVSHREWVLRSYALTLAAFTLRIYLGVHGVLLGTEAIDVPFEEMYIAVAWICWVPNLLAAEVYINSSRRLVRAPI